jgi:RND family efflux transporter MFP subunit
MATPGNRESNKQKQSRPLLRTLVTGGLKLLVAAAIVVTAVGAFRYQMQTSPRARRRKPPRQAKLVRVRPVEKSDCVTTVAGMGTVIPAQEVALKPQVTGKVVEISDDVIPGGVVQAGQKLVTIDHRDYEILVEQRRADVARAKKDLKVEQGNQAVAKQEYELLGEVVTEEDRELVLRQPQLAAAESALESAEAALDKAKLDLARCDIAAPFNAIVRRKHVDLGATVSLNSELVTLIGTDEAWVEVMVPITKLKWLDIPQSNGQDGADVEIYNPSIWGSGRHRIGRVIRLAGELETQGKMAKLVVAVDDPFCLKPENSGKPQLLMGSYVSAEIRGRMLTSVFAIDWSHLREKDTVWIMDDKGQLQIRPVEIAYEGPEQVYVSNGLSESEQLVVTDIAAPVAGMPLKVAQPDGDKDTAEQEGRLAARKEPRE